MPFSQVRPLHENTPNNSVASLFGRFSYKKKYLRICSRLKASTKNWARNRKKIESARSANLIHFPADLRILLSEPLKKYIRKDYLSYFMILTLINTKKFASIHNRMTKGDNFAFSASLKITIHFFISWENKKKIKQVFSTRKMPP